MRGSSPKRIVAWLAVCQVLLLTGGLIRRAGVLNVLLAGTALMFVCMGVAMSGVTLMHFWWALTLLGVGWNFLYIGGTTLLTEAHDPAEKAKIQGVNDFLIFAVMVSSSLTSGVVVTGSGGWAMLTELTLPFLVLTSLAISLLWLRERRAAAKLAADLMRRRPPRPGPPPTIRCPAASGPRRPAGRRPGS